MFPVYEGGLEIRQEGEGLRIRGRFPYRSQATVRDRGRVRKERFEPRAFSFAVDDPAREINLLRGHSFDQPLASKRAGSLILADGEDALTFEARLPPEAEQPGYMRDTVAMIRADLVGGISPGFAVPPSNVVPGAETLEAEPGNPGVAVRVIRAAVLSEISLVTRPAYPATELDMRAADLGRRARAGSVAGWL